MSYFCTIFGTEAGRLPKNMKQNTVILLTLLLCSGVLSCGRKQSSTEVAEWDAEEESVPDSVLAMGDTLLLDEEEETTAMPVAVDELFDDFVFAFDQSNRMQRRRVHFPFVVTAPDGDTLSVTHRRDWHHHYLFFQKDFCTALYNYAGQTKLSESTQGQWAVVEQIYLHQRQISQFHFDRDSLGQWLLTSGQSLSFEQSELGSFLDFYREFSTDSIFQRQHISNTLHYVTFDEDMEYEPLEGTISADQWPQFAPELPRDVITNIRYGQTYDNPNRMVLEMRGIASGLQVLLYFQQQAGEWRLTGLEN